ncbi:MULTISPECIES: DUF1700 domain-containing protein [Clostridia]|uniref:HAAS signaling domain-containing protein n=1 Tax=Clostridia TaxID=186801 RepID=UPI000EA14C23|nr:MULTISPECIES: DUF1700 domain-containing protein [Clostridia]NBJ67934.1 DUF1700 domain-containing protein [Roseburia sp. 1XD42-34]RKI82381.1 DUF1700 domain-containing protein [Clostridium sp. 1xD42-85]
MNKKEFMKKLTVGIKKLPKEEQQEVIQDFEEHFAIGLAEGKTEAEIAAALGTPNQVAKELVATYHLEKADHTSNTGNIFRAVWAVIGLGFFNLVIVLGPFIALVSIIASGWIVGGSFILSPLLMLVNVILYPDTFIFFDLFASIGLVGVGIFIIIGMYYVTRYLSKGFINYLHFNVKLVKGGLKDE